MNLDEQKFWEEVNRLVKPVVPTVLEYRLHYNDSGDIVMCTMSNHPESAQYLVVDKDVYDSYYRYRVVKGRLKLIESNPEYRARLQKSTKGFIVVKNHAGLLLEPDEQYHAVEYYEPTTY